MNNLKLIHLATQKINQQLRIFLEQKRPVLFLVSGGSALKILEEIDVEVLTLFASSLTLGVLDERFSQDETINNFAQFMKTRLFKDAEETGAIFIDTRVQDAESPEAVAERFENGLQKWQQENPTGRIMITLGMGPDGHTAGIMPFPENPIHFNKLFNTPARWVVTYDAGDKNPFPVRITTTFSFLKEVDFALLFVTGAEKQKALQAAYEKSGDLAETPAKIVQSMKTVALITDMLIYIPYLAPK